MRPSIAVPLDEKPRLRIDPIACLLIFYLLCELVIYLFFILWFAIHLVNIEASFIFLFPLGFLRISRQFSMKIAIRIEHKWNPSERQKLIDSHHF